MNKLLMYNFFKPETSVLLLYLLIYQFNFIIRLYVHT